MQVDGFFLGSNEPMAGYGRLWQVYGRLLGSIWQVWQVFTQKLFDKSKKVNSKERYRKAKSLYRNLPYLPYLPFLNLNGIWRPAMHLPYLPCAENGGKQA